MTSGQLKNKLRRLREEKEQELEEEAGELNLVPYLDIVTNIVIFLLASVTYTLAMSNVNAASPTYGSGVGAESTGPPPLNLTVNVSNNGFTVAGSGAVIKNKVTGTVPTVPKDPGAAELPWDKLAETIREIKDQYPEEHNIILMANPEIPYEKIVKTMDVVRQDAEGKLMFPDVSLSAGIL